MKDTDKATLKRANDCQDKLEQIESFVRQYGTKALVFETATWGDAAELGYIDSLLAEILDFLNNEEA